MKIIVKCSAGLYAGFVQIHIFININETQSPHGKCCYGRLPGSVHFSVLLTGAE